MAAVLSAEMKPNQAKQNWIEQNKMNCAFTITLSGAAAAGTH